MAGWSPPLRIREVDDRVHLGLEGFGDVEGATLQEAADALVARLLQIGAAVRVSGIGHLSSECGADPELIEFVWRLAGATASGEDVRELVFGSTPLAS